MAKNRRRNFEQKRMKKCMSGKCIQLCLVGLASVGTAAYAEAPCGLIGGQDGSGNAFSALVDPSGALTVLSISSDYPIKSVAINDSGVGLIGGEGDSTHPYAGYVLPDGSITPFSITTSASDKIVSVAINDAGNGLIGGQRYAALVTQSSVTPLTLTSVNSINSVAINSSGVGLIGGQYSNVTGESVMYAASVAANGSVTTISGVPDTGQWINSVAINDAGKGIIGGQGASSQYAAYVDPNTHVATTLSGLPTEGLLYSVAINSEGIALIGGFISTGAYAGSVNAAGVVTSLAGLSAGDINSVALNDAGAGIIGGLVVSDVVGPYAALVAPGGGLTPLSLGFTIGEIKSVAINQAGVGIIGGYYKDPSNIPYQYAALVAPNGSLTVLNTSLGKIYGVAISDATNPPSPILQAVTPQSAGAYGGAIQTQLAFSTALQGRFIGQNGTWNSASPSGVADLSLDQEKSLTASIEPLPKNSVMSQPKKENSFWIEPFGNYVNLKAEGSIPKYTNEVAGILAAYDHQGSHYLVGAALGYAFDYLHYSGSGHGKINEEMACVYGSYDQGHFWLEAAIWGGLYQLHNERHTLSTITSTTHTHGWIFDPHFEMAAPFAMDANKNYFVEPFVMFDWVNSWQHHFTESGRSGLNLVMKSLYGSLLQSELGLRFYEKFQYGWGRFLLEEKLSYVNQAPFHFKDTTTLFVGSASTFPIAVGSTKVRNLGSGQLVASFVPANQAYPFGGFVKWLAKTGHKIDENKLSFTLKQKIEGKNGTQKT